MLQIGVLVSSVSPLVEFFLPCYYRELRKRKKMMEMEIKILKHFYEIYASVVGLDRFLTRLAVGIRQKMGESKA